MKMETPKMDVVRFKEADVLAASPAPVAQSCVVTGSEDQIIGNAQVGGVNINDFEKIVNQLGLGTDSYFQAGANTTPINVQHLDSAVHPLHGLSIPSAAAKLSSVRQDVVPTAITLPPVRFVSLTIRAVSSGMMQNSECIS